MERFNSIYPFTTENIAGYLEEICLVGKKVLTITGSGDHVFNTLAQGAREITTFDVNPLCEYYLDLKFQAMKNLDYSDFLEFLLFLGKNSLNYEIFKKLNLQDNSLEFFEKKYYEVSYDGKVMRNSSLFNNKYFVPKSKIRENIYLDKVIYRKVQDILDDVSIRFINSNLKDLEVKEEFDYLFLSNVADYLNLMFEDNYLEKYFALLNNFSVKNIYFAYVYDFHKKKFRSVIDDYEEVERVFGNISKKVFPTALEGTKQDVCDAVLILRKER